MRQAAFNIPFSPDPSRRNVAEVQLFVSTDQGRTWQFVAAQPPNGRFFPFRAPRDGAYWFSSRTVDSRQVAARVEDLRAELYVIVDTSEPTVELETEVGVGGQIVTRLRAADATLDAQSLRLEYQPDAAGGWRTVAIDPITLQAQGTECQSALSWVPETAAGEILVRAEVSDRAGNRGVVNRKLVLPNVASRQPSSSSATPQVATDTPPAQPSTGGIAWSPTRLAGSNHATSPITMSPIVTSPIATSPSSTSSAGDSSIANQPTGAASLATDVAPLAAVPAPRIGDDFSGASPLSAVPTDDPRSTPPAGATGAPAASQTWTRDSITDLPRGERPRMTAARKFRLDYEIDAVGPGGVAEIQLWGTDDVGRNWKQWQVDDDGASPVEVETPADGVFGFRVVIVGKNGLTGRRPVPGELADLWVGVDTTRPTVRLTSVVYGEGPHAGELDIRWEANDPWLGDRPITITYSERSDGPWTTVAAGVPNSGQYFWRAAPQLPDRIFLRIEARDEAGNVGEFRIAEPINTGPLIPKARIRGIQPVRPLESARRMTVNPFYR